MQLNRWRAISELQAQHINNKYQHDVNERDTIISELKDKAKILSQQNTNAEVEIEGLRERYRQEMDAVARLRGTVSNTEAVRTELAERLSANAQMHIENSACINLLMRYDNLLRISETQNVSRKDSNRNCSWKRHKNSWSSSKR